jgi:hypothetical protein
LFWASPREEPGRSKPSWLHAPFVIDPREAEHVRLKRMENIQLKREVVLLNWRNYTLNRKCQTLTEENDLWRRHMSVLVSSEIAWKMAHAISCEAASDKLELDPPHPSSFKPIETYAFRGVN